MAKEKRVSWRDILQSLLRCRGKNVLDKPAIVEVDGEKHNFDVVQIESGEDKNKLIAFPTEDLK